MTTMKYLKVRKDSDALAYQRHIGKRLKARARALNISDPVVMPLSLKQGAPDISVAAERYSFGRKANVAHQAVTTHRSSR